MGEEIKIKARDGSGEFGAYLALADGKSGPGIIVIQEVFGVNAGIRQMCDQWARAGYNALAPDMFWRLEPGVQLTDKSEEEWGKAIDLFQRFNVDKGVEDIEESIHALRNRPECTGKIGVVGFCMGGLLAYLAATRTDSDASVSYYGGGIDQKLNEAHAIANPLILHLAEEDEFINKEAQRKIHEVLDEHPKVKIYDYPKVQHAFARVDGVHHDNHAARLAQERTEQFFAEHLSRRT